MLKHQITKTLVLIRIRLELLLRYHSNPEHKIIKHSSLIPSHVSKVQVSRLVFLRKRIAIYQTVAQIPYRPSSLRVLPTCPDPESTGTNPSLRPRNSTCLLPTW